MKSANSSMLPGTSQSPCPRCGKPVRPGVAGGLCSRCLFRGLGEDPVVPTFERYRILETLGEGGCGVVYVAEQFEPVRRQVALKVIKLGMDTRSVIARFEAERQALALMDHPNIARVFDAGATDEGRPFFVMELVQGIPITDHCDQNQLGTRQRLDLFIKVCHAIQHAHQKGIIHRDIKPSNILVTLHDGVSVPKVIDFGIAKATEGRLTDATVDTHWHQFLGTPAYMSPEQVEMSGLDIDTRSDIYALGALLYELLTGQTPFDAKELSTQGIDAMRRTIREREPVRPSTRLAAMRDEERAAIARQRVVPGARLPGQLRGDLDWIVMKCLEKDRTRRYETANGLAADLKRHLASEPVVAGPPSAVYRFVKFVRRNRAAVGGVAGVAAALLVGTAVSAWQAWRATVSSRAEATARQLAESARRLAMTNALAMRQRAYASDMIFAQQAVAVRHLARARELLGRWDVPTSTRPSVGTDPAAVAYPDLRGWEWRYLWSRSRPEPVTVLAGTWAPCRALAVSSDARFAALTDDAGRLALWNLVEDRLAWGVEIGDRNSQVAFAPGGETLAYVALVSEASGVPAVHELRLVDLGTREVRQSWSLPGDCRGMGFSGDGKQVVALVYLGGSGRAIQVWEAATGCLLASYPATYGWSMGHAFDVAAQVPLVAYGTAEGEARVLDWQTGEERLRVAVNGPWVSSLALSPDGRLLAANGSYNDSLVHLYDVATGKEIRVLEGHRDYIPSLRFTEDGKLLVSGSSDSTIRVWDLENPPRSKVYLASDDEISRVAVGPLLLSGSRAGKIQVWSDFRRVATDSASDSASGSVVLPGTHWVAGFHQPSGGLVTLGRDGVASRWEGRGLQGRVVIGQVPPPSFWGSGLSTDGRWLAALSQGSAWVFSVDQVGPSRELQAKLDGEMLIGFADHDRKVLLGKTGERSIRVFDRESGRELPRVELPGALAMSTDLAPDGRELLVFGPTSLFDWTQGSRREFGAVATYSAAFSASGRYIAFAGLDGAIGVWEVESLRRTGSYRSASRSFHTAAFSPDDRRVLGGDHGAESVVLWERETGLQLLSLPAVGVVVEAIRFSPDGHSIMALSRDGKAQVWTAPSWEEIAAARSRQSFVP